MNNSCIGNFTNIYKISIIRNGVGTKSLKLKTLKTLTCLLKNSCYIKIFIRVKSTLLLQMPYLLPIEKFRGGFTQSVDQWMQQF